MTSKPSKALPSTKSLIIAISFFIIANTALLAAVVSIGMQSLWRLPEWQVEKRKTQLMTMGADEFLLCRSVHSLHGLNLAAWWGHQQLKLNLDSPYDELRLEFKSQPRSRLDITFHSEFYLSLGSEPIFHQGWVFETGQLLKQDWAQLNPGVHRLEILSSGQVKLNQEQVATLPHNKLFDQFSIRGGMTNIYLQHLTLLKDGQFIYDSDFSIAIFDDSVVFKSFLLVFCLCLLLFLLFKFNLTKVFLIQIPLALSLALYLGWDYFLWSQRPLCSLTHNINQNAQTSGQNKFEKWRFNFLKKLAPAPFTPDNRGELGPRGYPTQQYYGGPIWCDPTCRFIEDENLGSVLEENRHRFFVVFLGSSQTNGSGASLFEKTFYALAMQKINRPDIVLLNLAKSSYRSDSLFEFYEELLKNLPPSLLIHNWGHNDFGESLDFGLKQVLELKQHRHLLFKEAISPEYYPFDQISSLYKITDKMGAKYNVSVIDWNHLLSQKFVESPIEMWWDWMHFNDLGHQRASEVFEKILKNELETRDKQLAL